MLRLCSSWARYNVVEAVYGAGFLLKCVIVKAHGVRRKVGMVRRDTLVKNLRLYFRHSHDARELVVARCDWQESRCLHA